MSSDVLRLMTAAKNVLDDADRLHDLKLGIDAISLDIEAEPIKESISNCRSEENGHRRPKRASFVVTAAELEFVCNGTHCQIYRSHFEGRPVILKTLKETSLQNARVISEFQVEREILQATSHPNIVENISTIADEQENLAEPKRAFFQFLDRPYFVLEELTGGILDKKLKMERSFAALPFTVIETFRLCRELASALKYFHADFDSSRLIIHRDLKPENIGFSSSGSLKLFDFNLSVIVDRKKDRDDTYELTGDTGSRRYMAPEVGRKMSYNEKVDMYSFGMIMYQIISGVVPFNRIQSHEEFHRQVFLNGIRPSLIEDDYGRKFRAGSQMRDLISQLWDADYRRRPSAAAALEIITQSEEAYLKKQSVHKTSAAATGVMKKLNGNRGDEKSLDGSMLGRAFLSIFGRKRSSDMCEAGSHI